MKTILITLAALLFFNAFIAQSQTFNYAPAWKRVDLLESQGLPKSALVIVDSIYRKAQQDKNDAQFIKAFIYTMKYRSLVEDGTFVQNLVDAERVADSVPFPLKPVLHSMLGEMYWWYFENNRYKFYNRTKTTQFTPDDIATWDLTRLIAKVTEHYKASLLESDRQKQVDLAGFENIVTMDNIEEEDHPSLYDFMVQRAIRFFENEEPGIIRPVSEFSMDNEDFFLPADQFSALLIDPKDTVAFKYITLRLFQQLLTAHLNDSDPDALATIDLQRLEFCSRFSTSPMKDSLYLNSLYFLEKKCTGRVSAAKVGLKIAEKLCFLGDKYNPRTSKSYQWEKKVARQKCVTTLKKYQDMNDSCDNDFCKNALYHFSDLEFTYKHLISEIDREYVKLTIERENVPGKPFRALVTYKNTDTVYVRIIKTTEGEYEKLTTEYKAQQRKTYLEWDRFIIDRFKNQQPLQQFKVMLPNNHDFQQHSAEIAMPPLGIGLYFILTGTNSNLDYEKHEVNFGLTRITQLSYVDRQNKDGVNDFYVLNRETGLPMEGVKAECWSQKYDYKTRENTSHLYGSYVSNKDGYFQTKRDSNNNESFWINFSYQNDYLSTRDMGENNSSRYFNNYWNNEWENRYTKTFFFTDRSIYRPGQTIYFKGIVIETDGNKNNRIVPAYRSTVQLSDVNGQKVADVELIANEFGSFSGSFVAPSNGLNGLMTIRNENGSIAVSVEDYKRPKFEVKFDTIRDGLRLTETVKVKGMATSYSGVAIDDAKVTYRVVRQTRFSPWWHNWWSPMPVSPEKEIANGTLTTDKNGAFEVSFKAIPDKSVSPSTDPTFNYTVYADVTDINGETHTSQKDISIGYKAMVIRFEIPDKVEKNGSHEFTISTLNRNGDFVAASGKLTAYVLKNPGKVFRERKWAIPDTNTLSKAEFYKLFYDDPYADEMNPTTWETKGTILEIPFNTAMEKTITLAKLSRWADGMYKIVLCSADRFGEKVETTSYVTVFDKKDKKLPYPMADWYEETKVVGEPGEKAELVFGSGYPGAKMLVEVEANRKIVRSEWVSLDNEQQLFSHPLLEEYRGNIGIHCTFIRNNRLYAHHSTIVVPYTNKKLDISFETFRNKLQSGEKEEWRIRVKGKTGEKTAAEMVATMYDASLDAFKPHSFDFGIWPSYTPSLLWNNDHDFTATDLTRYPTVNSNYAVKFDESEYHLNWFDFGYVAYNRLYNRAQDRSPQVTSSAYSILSSKKQKGTVVSGTVYDITTGEPMPGVNIVIVGTTIGTRTDADGNFTLTSEKNDIIVRFSFIGYQPIDVNLKQKGKVKMKITLDVEVSKLEEIVVVGYGTVKKSNVTGSISRMKSENFNVGAKMAPRASDDLTETPKVNLINIKARTNLNETVFFYPQLQTDENGDVLLKFIMPEALTRWKMLGFAHTRDLKYGFTENELITQKQLMVTPNAPRFFREGDTMTFTAKLSSLSEKDLKGTVQLMLFDALTMKSIDVQMHNNKAQQPFAVKKGESVNLNWDIIVPAGLQAVSYRVVAKSEPFSDGEEAVVPVLTNRMLVTETLPLPIKGKQTKTFTLDKLLHNTSTTLRNHKLTLEYTSNPAWYAIQALPYIMEYPYECAEQTFSRFYANSIASHIANSNPKIKQVFDSWKNVTPDALLSNLEKNQDLKGLLLEETPWVMDAKSETERKQRLAVLFDLNHMSDELGRALDKLQKMQASNGGWPWFAGMPDDRYITQHIVCGMGKLDHLGVKNVRDDSKTWDMIRKAIGYIDDRIADDYSQLKRRLDNSELSKRQIGYNQIHYLYARSFFRNVPVGNKAKEAFDYYLGQARKYWLSNSFYMEGMTALALNRYDDHVTPVKIIGSFKEHSISSEELGMYWKNESGWFWYQAPIETQALMIEAFDEVAHDTTAVNEMKVWLLKQKQTQDWKTTRATVEACYALLLRGTDGLANDNQVSITVGDQKLELREMPDVKVEAGTGYFKTSWNGTEVKPQMGIVSITKKDEGVSWGALYWQYFEQFDKITSSETPLKLKKNLFVERNTAAGPVIELISDTTPLKPGDLIKVRIELRVDREMEYVHMKDMRAAGLEPVNFLSGYKYQDGLGYYESTRDAATNFFFGWLPKGTYVFEYPLRVTHDGNFSNGITTIQCMYAPEYTSHSEGVRVLVGKR